MAHFVRRHKADEFAHDFVFKGHPTCFGIDGCGLHKKPVTQQCHYIVVPIDIGLQNLPRPWVAHVWAIGVGNGGGQIAHYRIAHIFRTPFGVFFGCGWVFGDDSVFKASSLKSHLPIFDALFEVFAPFFWGRAVYIIDNGFFGFYQFTAIKFFHVFLFDFQTPTVEITNGFTLLHIQSVIDLPSSKPSHTLVKIAAAHGFFRK